MVFRLNLRSRLDCQFHLVLDAVQAKRKDGCEGIMYVHLEREEITSVKGKFPTTPVHIHLRRELAIDRREVSQSHRTRAKRVLTISRRVAFGAANGGLIKRTLAKRLS